MSEKRFEELHTVMEGRTTGSWQMRLALELWAEVKRLRKPKKPRAKTVSGYIRKPA